MTAVLALATATERVGVAVKWDGGTGSVCLQAGRRHGETLAPAIRSLLELSGLAPAGIGLVAVDTGPGLFTGLRVGVATAKAFASALGVPVAVSSSLDLLALALRGTGHPVAAVVDARRGECFWALYDQLGVRVTEPEVAPPDRIIEALAGAGHRPLLVGDGARRYHREFTGAGFAVADPVLDHPSAAVLAQLAGQLPALPAESVTATYLRGPDVRIGWETR